jgi:predicted Zn-dependent protease
MRLKVSKALIALGVILPLFLGVCRAASITELKNPIVSTMRQELDRSFARLKNAGKAPVYYLAYRIYDGKTYNISGKDGALWADLQSTDWRRLSVDLRVGSPHFDSTHYSRDQGREGSANAVYEGSPKEDSSLPEHGAGIALQQSLWLKTSQAFNIAQTRYAKLVGSKAVLSADDDKAGDFTLAAPVVHSSSQVPLQIDPELWRNRMRAISKSLVKFPHLRDPWTSLTAETSTRYLVDSAGTELAEQRTNYTVTARGDVLTEDGAKLWFYDSICTNQYDKLPNEEKLIKWVESLGNTLEQLRTAKMAEPYVGPAILSGRAAAVFFHETFGHRVEAQHQKNPDEGATFAKRLGLPVTASFISIIDDPTRKTLNGHELVGNYQYDDQGTPAQPVTLVDHGILKGFLTSRAPVLNIKKSNGHARACPGWTPAPRQANLIVSSEVKSQYDPKRLREMLVKECRRQNKPYGLYFEEIAGGFTHVTASSDQSFQIMPLKTYKIFVDGRPDQLVRGVDVVGTPLTVLEKIIATGTDYAIFNGVCGRESGMVPLSAASPSLLIQSIEVKRSQRSFEQKPTLPDPMLEVDKAKAQDAK